MQKIYVMSVVFTNNLMKPLILTIALLFSTPAWAGNSHWLFQWTTLGTTSSWEELFTSERECRNHFDIFKKDMGFINERFADRRGANQIGPNPYFFSWFDGQNGASEHKLLCTKLSVK